MYLGSSPKPPSNSRYSSVAQLAEHLTVNQVVTGSSPVRGAKYWGVAKLVKALDFDSSISMVQIHPPQPDFFIKEFSMSTGEAPIL